jgi:hypothetical protein
MRNPISVRIAAGLVLGLAILGPLTLVSHANAGGPPGGATGAPGEGSCIACHNTYALNSGTATFGITGPANVTSGGSYPVTVAFGSTTGSKHGFQIVAKTAAGTSVGTWTVTMPGKTQSTGGVYHEQTLAGTALTSWTMTWNAPAVLPGGPVTFYAAGNEADGLGTQLNDYIYTASKKSYRLIMVSDPGMWQVALPHTFTVSGGPWNASDLYFIIPSFDPTPFPLGFIGSPLELEVTPDILFDYVQQYPQIFQNFIGVLDAAGQATATIVVPPLPGLSGLTFNFAALTLSSADLSVTDVSNRETIVLQ